MPTTDESPRRDRAPRRRSTWSGGPAPIVAALLLCALAVGAWRAFVQPLMPPRRTLFDPAPQRFVDVEGAEAPLYLRGHATREGLLIVGDSRALAGLSLAELERQGVRAPALLWNGLAQLDHLLAGARQLPPRRLLVCLSPASVYDKPRPHMAERLAEERATRVTARIDEQLGQALDDLRQRLVRPVLLTQLPNRAFEEELDPRAQVGIYGGILRRSTEAARYRRLRELERELRALRDEGWQIACVRLPISRGMFTVEERAFPARRFRKLCDALELPFLDLSRAPFRTFDGSHLVAEDAEQVSAVVGAWLAGLRDGGAR